MKRKELLNRLDLSTFIAFDFETTGLDHQNDRVIEVAAIKFIDGDIADRYVELVNPGIFFREWAQPLLTLLDFQ